jgi:hypothetical protein
MPGNCEYSACGSKQPNDVKASFHCFLFGQSIQYARGPVRMNFKWTRPIDALRFVPALTMSGSIQWSFDRAAACGSS